MAPRWAPDTLVVKVSRAVNLWQTQAPNQAASLPLSPLRSSYYRLHEHPTINYSFCCLNWKHISNSRSRGRKGWLCRASHVRQKLGLHTSTLCLNTSASRWSAGLSQHMSRIRSTLDTVSKAVSGTHTELKSKIARLKPNVSQASKEGQVKDSEAALKTEKGNFSPVPAPSHVDSLTSAATLNSTKTSLKVEEASNKTSAPSHNNVQSTTTATTPSHNNVQSTTSTTTPSNNSVQSTITTTTPSHNNVQSTTSTTIPSELDLKEKRLKPAVTMSESTISFKRQDKSKLSKDGRETKATAISKATATPLLHPSTLSVSLDETYNYVAHHINNYFGSTTKAHENTMGSNANPSTSIQGQSSDITPVSKGIESTSMSAPSTQKKGLGHYLSYTAPTVQAFVGSYLSPLVPKFRTADPKLAVVEQRNVEDAPAKQTVVTVTKEPNAADEKAKMLLLQREKIIARLSVDNRTRALVQALHRASDVRIYINRVEDLSYHLLEFPETRGVAVKEKVIPCLLRMRQASDEGLRAAVREALSLVGYHDPVRGRGIRLLSIDGGGLRGLLALQTLHKLEILTGRPIYQLFDYICGVSTGAIVGFMLGLFQMPLSECDDLYRKLGSDVFKQNVIVGTVKMGWNHAFYDSETWEKILKEKMGSDLLVETSRNPKCPKVAAVSTIVNQGTPLKAYVFRNYNLLPGVRSHYRGGCQHQLWQAVRASSAAPGYFQEFALGNDLHQDGGLLINNPTALAIHECKCLWPNTPLECVVSLGTGRFETSGKHSTTHTSLKTKLANIISSATDTEEVHTMLDALLPPDTYFRFNPHMSEEVTLDDSRQEKLNLLQAEALRYLERNEEKMKKAAAILTREKYSVQRLSDWARLRADMYDGLPSFSAKL